MPRTLNMTRLALIGLIFAVHTATATIDIHKIKQMKAAAIHSAVDKIHDLKQTAVHNLKHIADDIDLNNLHKLDILQIGPTLQQLHEKKYNLLKQLYHKPATKVNVVHIYGDELSSHFDHGKLIHHDHASLVHDYHGHHHHGHHHGHYHDLPPWVMGGAYI